MSSPEPGRLAIVLHSHMPYVEGFGTWPFGEEWLFEAIATCYLPLLDVLDGPGGDALTLSLTPVLCDQLEDAGAMTRFQDFIRDIRGPSHALDVGGCRDSGRSDLAAALELASLDYVRSLERFTALDDAGLLGALAPHAAWTSSATHAVLPLVATDAGVNLQLQIGIDSHDARFGGARPWQGGFWLPECAHSSWLDVLLDRVGVRAVCVELTDVFGHGDPRHLRPYRTDSGPLLVGVDRAVIDLLWAPEGYPSHGAYRDYHHRTTHDHHPWANDGSVYDRERARGQARLHAADFVRDVSRRVASGGLSVCAIDTELLGHWWYEGVDWLGAVLEQAAEQGLEIVHLDDALASGMPSPADPIDAEILGTTTWGTPRDLSTWDGPQVADLVWQARAAELDVVALGTTASPRAIRELLALQSSDWAFMVTRDLAGDYPVERARDHHAALRAELSSLGSGDPALRNLSPYATVAALLAQ